MMPQPSLPGSRGIYVDNVTAQCGVFLLTHAHSDHTAGLGKESWNRGLIHCSHITAKIIISRKSCSPKILRPHALDEPFDVEDPLERCQLRVRATFIDGYHCPGSVLIAFEGLPGGPVLHTGDFRYYDGLQQHPVLQRFASPTNHCQLILLDVTCAHEVLVELPTKETSIGMLLDLLDRHASENVFLHSHGLGDELLLEAVAKHDTIEKLLFVDAQRYEEIKIVDPLFCNQYCQLITQDTNLQDGRLVIVVANSRTRRSDARFRDVSGIEISCSTLWWARRLSSIRIPHTGSSIGDVPLPVLDEYGIWHVLWSMHVSLGELRSLVAWICPDHVQATCKSLVEDNRALCDLNHLIGDVDKDVLGLRQRCSEADACSNVESQCNVSKLNEEMRVFFAPGPMADDTLACFHEADEYGHDLPCLLRFSCPCTPTLPEEASTAIDSDNDVHGTSGDSCDSFDMDTPFTQIYKKPRL